MKSGRAKQGESLAADRFEDVHGQVHGAAGPPAWREGAWVRFCLCGREFRSVQDWQHVPALFDHLAIQPRNHTLFSSGLGADEYAAALRADLERAYDALGGLQRDVERECAKSRPSKQRLREALLRSDLGRWSS